jgi:plastocyanin
MRFISLVFTLLIFSVELARAGTIVGHVKAEPRPEVKEDIDAGKYESRQYKFIERIDYDELKDFVVYVDQPGVTANYPPPKPVQVIIQKDGTFRPHVLPVMVGTTVEWPNQDEIYHNVFSMSDPKPFDLGIYKSNQIKKVTFDKPGRIDVFCSIHTKMNCIILVLENPFFAVTDKNGNFKISNVPAGTYNLKSWHERLPSQVKSVVVPDIGEVNVGFVMSIAGLPKY